MPGIAASRLSVTVCRRRWVPDATLSPWSITLTAEDLEREWLPRAE
jgi:hypothetical protein